jgi:hypothetical protein
MKPIEVRIARKNAIAKGFTERVDSGDEYHWYVHEGKKTAWRLKISHGARELVQRELRANAMQLKMSGEDFRKVLACDYDAAWVAKKYLAFVAQFAREQPAPPPAAHQSTPKKPKGR